MNTHPDYSVSPGAFLLDWLDTNSMKPDDLATARGLKRPDLDSLLAGTRLKADLAEGLAQITGFPVTWWLKIDSQYGADLKRIGRKVPEGPAER